MRVFLLPLALAAVLCTVPAVVHSAPLTSAHLEEGWSLCLEAIQADDPADTLGSLATDAGYQWAPGENDLFGKIRDELAVVLFVDEDDRGNPICIVRSNAMERDELIARSVAFWRGKGMTTTLVGGFGAHDQRVMVILHQPNEFFQTTVSRRR